MQFNNTEKFINDDIWIYLQCFLMLHAMQFWEFGWKCMSELDFRFFSPPVLMKCELPCLYVATWWNSFILLSAISKQWQPSISGKPWRNLSFLNNKLKRTCYLTYHGIMVLYGMLNQYEKKKRRDKSPHFLKWILFLFSFKKFL